MRLDCDPNLIKIFFDKIQSLSFGQSAVLFRVCVKYWRIKVVWARIALEESALPQQMV
jgi:hypothetical protein